MDAMPQVPLGQSNLFLNPDRRCPCVLLLDTSYSMDGDKIDQLNLGLEAFQRAISTDLVALKRVEIAVVTFGGGVTVAQPFTTVDRLSMPRLTAEGDTPMGEAILKGLDAPLSETLDPLGDGLRRGVEGTCGGSLGQAAIDDSAHHGLSTFGREAGIVVDVHSVFSVRAEASQPQSLRPGPNGQPPESSHLALDAIYGVHCKLRRLAVERGVHADHFATTLLGVVATAERTVLVQIGDGGIVLGSPWGSPWRLAFTPHHGEYRNECRFVSDTDAIDHLQQSSFDGPPGTLVMFTDGLEDLLLAPFSYAVHTPLFDRIGCRMCCRRRRRRKVRRRRRHRRVRKYL